MATENKKVSQVCQREPNLSRCSSAASSRFWFLSICNFSHASSDTSLSLSSAQTAGLMKVTIGDDNDYWIHGHRGITQYGNKSSALFGV